MSVIFRYGAPIVGAFVAGAASMAISRSTDRSKLEETIARPSLGLATAVEAAADKNRDGTTSLEEWCAVYGALNVQFDKFSGLRPLTDDELRTYMALALAPSESEIFAPLSGGYEFSSDDK